MTRLQHFQVPNSFGAVFIVYNYRCTYYTLFNYKNFSDIIVYIIIYSTVLYDKFTDDILL